jgi:hypothetical protein
VAGSPVTGHTYLYDDIDRRTQATLADGSYWSYSYDDRNEVTSGKRYWAEFHPGAGPALRIRLRHDWQPHRLPEEGRSASNLAVSGSGLG